MPEGVLTTRDTSFEIGSSPVFSMHVFVDVHVNAYTHTYTHTHAWGERARGRGLQSARATAIERNKGTARKRQRETEGVYDWVGESESAKSITSMHAKKNRWRRRVRAPAGTPR